ncbi:MAG: hypothetical protein QXN05_03710 [Acidilobaceae archaeon]
MYWSAKVIELRELSSGYYMLKAELLGDVEREPEPMQFIMLWVPQTDEMPMSVADYELKRLSIIFRVRGEGTKALSKGPKFIGVRGFYGKGLSLKPGERVLFIAGGIGIAPFPYLARVAEKVGASVSLVWGVRKGSELFDISSLAPFSSVKDVKIATEDCSEGFCGTAVDLAIKLYKERSWEKVIAVGPNSMLAKVCETLSPNVLVSLEAMTKCGIGVCGSCTLRPRPLLLCVHGAIAPCSEVRDFLVRAHA